MISTLVGSSKKETFGVLRERIWKRINGWDEKFLSSAGREVMIKAVLQAIPSYLMGCFLLPRNITDVLERAIRNFWWSGGTDKKMAWLPWNKLCEPKASGDWVFVISGVSTWLSLQNKDGDFYCIMSPCCFEFIKLDIFRMDRFSPLCWGSRPSATWI